MPYGVSELGPSIKIEVIVLSYGFHFPVVLGPISQGIEKYAKFLKGLLSNKARLEEACMVTMNERCSAVLLNKLPSKEKDPGSFTIPCLGEQNQQNELGIANKIYQSHGVIVRKMCSKKIEKFPPPLDFVYLVSAKILESENLGNAILSISFTSSMIDVFNKKITLRIGSEEVIFDVDQSMKKPCMEDDECYEINDLDMVIQSAAQELLENENLEDSINRPDFESRRPNSETLIRRIDHINTPYSQKTQEQEEMLSDHLYSASAIEIDRKKPELKDLLSHLEYAYLKGDETCPVIISSKLTKKEKTSLLRVLEK
ncbi:hypothetical protein Tco_0123549 [Tanacetum coccineum]